MNTRYKSKTAEWVRRAVLAVLLAVLLFALGRCIYRNRTVAGNERVCDRVRV